MKVLLVGGGGREHALAWKIRRDDPAAEVIAAPGNPGIAEVGRCAAVRATDAERLVRLATEERVDLVVVGPEGPLAGGVVDALQAARIPAFGPTAAAARIESSKVYAKELMQRMGVPTAHAERHTDVVAALRAVYEYGAPVVIKASGLAAGKGAIVCQTLGAAERAVHDMLGERTFGAAGEEILVEEFMRGEELSLFVLTDGTNVVPMLPAQDHKRLLEGDRGPNTGGMGAYAPVSIGDAALVRRVVSEIIEPTLAGMREDGHPFTGLLYAGLMLTRDGPKVVEFNCRFGDPETQALLPLLESNLLDVLLAVANGDDVRGRRLAWSGRAALTTVLAAEGYPDAPRLGDPITLPPDEPDALVFHAGTGRDAAGRLVTAGGRVLAVTGLGDTLREAREASQRAAGRIGFDGRHYRIDLGWRELQRAGAGATRN
ncbi:MAG TPA: phosphoribosylamine--glycine ligase [Gemmatimonadaceae bacterium]|nr:phosphoribosylamine--glycine ligase [Gemmatimonadaceae bacterium]